MELAQIRTEEQNEAALSRISELWDFEEGTPEANELYILSLLVEDFENEFYKIEAPTPIEAVLFYLDQNGLNKSELGKVINSKSRASEFFAGKKELSINNIRVICSEWQISPKLLIRFDA